MHFLLTPTVIDILIDTHRQFAIDTHICEKAIKTNTHTEVHTHLYREPHIDRHTHKYTADNK